MAARKYVRATLNLSMPTKANLDWLMERRGSNMGETVGWAIDLIADLQRRVDNGGELLIEQNGKTYLVIFR